MLEGAWIRGSRDLGARDVGKGFLFPQEGEIRCEGGHLDVQHSNLFNFSALVLTSLSVLLIVGPNVRWPCRMLTPGESL